MKKPKLSVVTSATPTAEDLNIRAISKIDRPRSWAIYGRSGSGKTTFSCTFPKPLLLVDIRDQGTDSVSDVKDVDVMEPEDWEDIEDVYWFLKKSKHKYKSVVLDTITQLQQMCLQYLLRDKRKDSARAGDWGTLSKREWGEASAMMKDKITDFRDLGIECIFLAQERTTEIDTDDVPSDVENLLIPEVGPAAMKSVAGHLNASVSVIGNTFIRIKLVKKEVKGKKIEREEPQYCLRIGPNPFFVTKIRKPIKVLAPAFVENPTYADIVEIIKGA